jgi:hypothetical protein
MVYTYLQLPKQSFDTTIASNNVVPILFRFGDATEEISLLLFGNMFDFLLDSAKYYSPLVNMPGHPPS